MARPKLLTTPGVPVAEWAPTAAERNAAAPPLADLRRGLVRMGAAMDPAELRTAPREFGPRELLRPERWWPGYFCSPSFRVRRNQRSLTAIEWQRFIHAIEALATAGMSGPTFQDFVQIHVRAMDPNDHSGHAWGAHTMGNHDGRNFLAWHREYLAKLEARLMAINPAVTIPYWDWVTDRAAIPAPLSNRDDIRDWGITRGLGFNGNGLATAVQLDALLAQPDFGTFQTTLEEAPYHNLLHGLVGGTMQTSASPADPLFWLHHAFIDKVWADWQERHPTTNPANRTEQLEPPPHFTRRVSQVFSVQALGYVYQ